MWVFTKYGFVSVVSHYRKPSRVLVRGRRKKDVQAIWDFMDDNGLFGKGNIPKLTNNTGTDYPWRMNVSKSAWAKTMWALCNDLDYCNFKDSLDKKDQGLVRFAHRVWADGIHMLENELANEDSSLDEEEVDIATELIRDYGFVDPFDD